MKNEIKYEFIASPKVIRYKLGATAADVLATLVSKHQYWKNEGRLIDSKGRKGFHISVDNIREETCFGKDVIQKRIKLLEKEGLIERRRQGLTKPNIYYIDKNKIDKYIEDHKEEYKRWRLSIRAIKVVVSPKDTLKDENTTSRKGNSSLLEYDETVITKNKNTKNKKTKNKNLTNQASLVSEIHLGPMLELEKEIELEKVISDLRSDDDSDINERVKFLFKFLCSLVPSFKGFSMSNDDRELLLTILQSEIHDYKLASKIISNTTDIVIRRKESRFGNLFVGINKMIANHENLCL
jgi:hypothetical protein